MVDEPTRQRPRRRAGRPAGVDSAETRDALLRAAVETFAENGLARTTLRQVADAAGLTTGTLYHHYATKEALYIAAFTWAVDQIYADYTKAIEHAPTLRERLLVTLERTRQMAKRSPAILNLVLRAWVEHQDVTGEPLPEPDSARRFIRTIVDDACRNGEIEASDRRDVYNVFRAAGWGLVAIGLTGTDHLDHAATGMKRVLKGSMFQAPEPAARTRKR